MGSSSSCCGSEKVNEGMTIGAEGNSSSTWRIFIYKELQVATNGFSKDNKLGEGGFGSVYWGTTSDGLRIAVKKLKSMNSKAEMEFAVEVEVLGRARFKELVDPKLRGNFDENQLKQGIHVAALGVQSEAEKRPTMKEVVGLLKGYDPRSEEMQLRIESIRYEEGLMAKDQASDDENGGGSPYDESSAGVFGAMDVQKMQDPYNRYGDRRIAKHG
ncbi:PTI1-like tyrosine-protein kinase [Camellia lanceoleosa]|uniref:PTI1-like tyrosine-protein kinase n=1 Tax=Camellia lanceoleosa TaxID=1840588 RepID=A0ACC0FQV5_9ERIC|nr:PTI1-like tyrosine-protein kinase [Camellia lanceoleosa]